jgi:hypothetical protein
MIRFISSGIISTCFLKLVHTSKNQHRTEQEKQWNKAALTLILKTLHRGDFFAGVSIYRRQTFLSQLSSLNSRR